MKPQRKQASVLDDHYEDLTRWLAEKPEGEQLSFGAAVERLAARGVKTTDSSLSRWWKATAPRRMLARITSGQAACAQLDAHFGAHPAPAISTLVDWLKTLVAQQVATGAAPDVDALTRLFKPILEWAKLEEHRQDRALDQEKFAAGMRTKIEAGIEAIHAEIKGDAEAEALVARLKERVLKAAHEP